MGGNSGKRIYIRKVRTLPRTYQYVLEAPSRQYEMETTAKKSRAFFVHYLISPRALQEAVIQSLVVVAAMWGLSGQR